MTTISNPYIIHGCDMAHLTNASTSYLPAKAQFLWQTFSRCKWIKYYPAPSSMGTALEKVHLATDLAKTRLERLPTKGQRGCWWQVFCQPPSPDLLIDLNKTNFTVSPPCTASLLLKAVARASPALGGSGYLGAASGWLSPAVFHAQRDTSDLSRVCSGAGKEQRSRAAPPAPRTTANDK